MAETPVTKRVTTTRVGGRNRPGGKALCAVTIHRFPAHETTMGRRIIEKRADGGDQRRWRDLACVTPCGMPRVSDLTSLSAADYTQCPSFANGHA